MSWARFNSACRVRRRASISDNACCCCAKAAGSVIVLKGCAPPENMLPAFSPQYPKESISNTCNLPTTGGKFMTFSPLLICWATFTPSATCLATLPVLMAMLATLAPLPSREATLAPTAMGLRNISPISATSPTMRPSVLPMPALSLPGTCTVGSSAFATAWCACITSLKASSWRPTSTSGNWDKVCAWAAASPSVVCRVACN